MLATEALARQLCKNLPGADPKRLAREFQRAWTDECLRVSMKLVRAEEQK